MHTILLAELADDTRRATTGEKERALRARFHRRLASWSDKRRIVQTMLVVDDGGTPYATLEEQADALSRHWRRQLSESHPIDRRVAEEKLRHSVALRPGSLRPLDFDAFSALFDHLPHSAPGPYGLPYACWLAAGDRARRTLYAVYNAVAAGAEVPADFNESFMIFIPKSATRPGDLAYQAPPSGFRPLNLSNTAQKIVSNALNATLEEAALALVSPIQREFVKHRSLIDNLLDVEFVMESAAILGARRAGTVLFDIAAAFPSVE